MYRYYFSSYITYTSQDLGEPKVQNTLNGMVSLNKIIFTKKCATLLLSTLAMMLDVLAARHTPVCSLLDILPLCSIK